MYRIPYHCVRRCLKGLYWFTLYESLLTSDELIWWQCNSCFHGNSNNSCTLNLCHILMNFTFLICFCFSIINTERKLFSRENGSIVESIMFYVVWILTSARWTSIVHLERGYLLPRTNEYLSPLTVNECFHVVFIHV